MDLSSTIRTCALGASASAALAGATRIKATPPDGGPAPRGVVTLLGASAKPSFPWTLGSAPKDKTTLTVWRPRARTKDQVAVSDAAVATGGTPLGVVLAVPATSHKSESLHVQAPLH